MERKLLKAETIQLEWSMVAKGVMEGKGKGTLFLKAPRKVRINIKMEMAGRKEEMSVVSDGKLTKRAAPDLPNMQAQKTGEHIRDMMVLYITRSGFLVGPGALDTPKPEDYGTIDPRTRLLVSQFKLTEERKIGERVASREARPQGGTDPPAGSALGAG